MASFSIISDIHIQQSQDANSIWLKNFCEHPLVQKSNYVIFLGDIFDLFVGTKKEFYLKFRHEWDWIGKLTASGPSAYFIEGNHDLYLNNQHLNQRIFFLRRDLTLEVDKIRYVFTHGDFLNREDEFYHHYRNFLHTQFARVLTKYMFPYKLLDYLGIRAALCSRKKSKKYFDLEGTKQMFRMGAEQILGLKADIVVSGHSHIKDEWCNSSGTYLNNGYVPNEKTFLYIEGKTHRFVSLV